MIAPRELDTLPQQWVEGNATYDKGLQRRVFDTGVHRPADPLFPYTAGAFGSGANMAFRTDYLRRRRGFDAALGTGTVAMGGDDLAAFYDVVSDGHRLVYEPGAIVLHQHYRDYAALRRQTYGYGAGLGAHLTRCLIADPRLAFALVLSAATALRRVRTIVRPPVVGDLPRVPGRSEPAAAARPDVGSLALSPQPPARPSGGGMTVVALASQAPPATGAIPVLLYHSVSDTPAGTFGPFTVSAAQLAAHLDLMLEQGYQPITVRQLLDGLARVSCRRGRSC